MNCFYCKEKLTIDDSILFCRNANCSDATMMFITKSGNYFIPVCLNKKRIGNIEGGLDSNGYRRVVFRFTKYLPTQQSYHKLPFGKSFNDSLQDLMNKACKWFNQSKIK